LIFEKFTGIEGLISERISLVEELGLYWTEDPYKKKEKNNVSLLLKDDQLPLFYFQN